MPVIENEILRVSINQLGAELKSIVNNATGLNYLWNADPAYWAKSSPVLFPIVGTLKSDTYFFNGKAFNLGRHGFAREKEFVVEDERPDQVTLLLVSSESTLVKYPFAFEFRINYKLSGDRLDVRYHVTNPDKVAMYFSVGGHPAFRVPLEEELKYTDYQLVFEKPETAGRWMISPEGLIDNHSTPLLQQGNVLPLTHELFYKDAVVLKGLVSTQVRLSSPKSVHGVLFDFTGFPFLGIWAAKNAGFVCIEPWCGIADSVDTTQDLTVKEGIIELPAASEFKRTWSASFY